MRSLSWVCPFQQWSELLRHSQVPARAADSEHRLVPRVLRRHIGVPTSLQSRGWVETIQIKWRQFLQWSECNIRARWGVWVGGYRGLEVVSSVWRFWGTHRRGEDGERCTGVQQHGAAVSNSVVQGDGSVGTVGDVAWKMQQVSTKMSMVTQGRWMSRDINQKQLAQ